MKKRIIAGAAAALSASVTIGSCGLYGPPEDPSPTLYGPPEITETTTATQKAPEYSAENNIPEDVYGPPEWFDNEVEDEEEADEFDAEETAPSVIYGPPEWFEDEDVEEDEEDEEDDDGKSSFFDVFRSE